MMRLRSDRAVTITNAVESNPNIVATCEAELKGTRKDEDRRKMARIEKDQAKKGINSEMSNKRMD